jgi:hypothetical protein
MGVVYRVLDGKPGGRAHLRDPDINGRIILTWILKKKFVRV